MQDVSQGMADCKTNMHEIVLLFFHLVDATWMYRSDHLTDVVLYIIVCMWLSLTNVANKLEKM